MIVKIRDPRTHNILVQIKNPKVPISKKRQISKQILDLDKHALTNEEPNFGPVFQQNKLGQSIRGWDRLSMLAKPK